MEKDCKNEELQEITLMEFAKKVIQMRDSQRTYFRTRNQGAFFESKRLETAVDKIAKEASLPKQKSIFDELNSGPVPNFDKGCIVKALNSFDTVLFNSMDKFPERSQDDDELSVTVLLHDHKELSFVNIGYYDYGNKEWVHFGEESMDLICWCNIPDASEFVKQSPDLKIAKHRGYVG